MKLSTPILLVACACVPLFAFAAPQDPDADAPSVDDIGWLAGTWTVKTDGMEQEEHWLAPKGGMMLGLHRDYSIERKRVVSWEYLRIETRKDGGVDYLASPGGGEPTPFRLVSAEKGKAVFENLEHDFPQRILYSLSDDVLTARIEDESGDEGMQWSWKRSD